MTRLQRWIGVATAVLVCATWTDGARSDELPAAATTSERAFSVGIDFEQDSVLLPKTDQDYTEGTELVFGGWKVNRAPVLRYGFDAQRLLDKGAALLAAPFGATFWNSSSPEEQSRDTLLPEYKPVGAQSVYVAHELALGVSAFTPRKGLPSREGPACVEHGCVLHQREPVYNDRPYASLTYLQFDRTVARGRVAFSSSLTIGALGLQVAKVVQTAIHDAQTDPGGWRHQISNGGEPTVGYSPRVKLLAAALPASSLRLNSNPLSEQWDATTPRSRWFDATLDSGFAVGYYTRLQSGAIARLGLIRSPFWATEREPIQATVARKNVAKPEIYLIAAGGASLWLYNALLQGQFRHSTVALHFHPDGGNSADTRLRRWVAEGSFGLAGRIPIGSRVNLALGGRRYFLTRVFDGPQGRTHGYWGAYIRLGRVGD